MQNMMEDMAKANIRTDGLFLNADAGFDCAALRSVLKSYGIVSRAEPHQKNRTENAKRHTHDNCPCGDTGVLVVVAHSRRAT